MAVKNNGMGSCIYRRVMSFVSVPYTRSRVFKVLLLVLGLLILMNQTNRNNPQLHITTREGRQKINNTFFQVNKSDGLITEKPLCPIEPPNLVGQLKVERWAPSMEKQELNHTELERGGHYHPPECRARHKVAIIIPYRDRATHLSILLHHLHPFLQRQQVDYVIFVVEQAGNRTINRGMLRNVGALEALKQYGFSCFIFHDVDLLPENDRNLYTCPEQQHPRHMSIAIDVFNYKLPYVELFGGVTAMTVEQFTAVNGYSNRFWGWGAEDDDIYNRITYNGFSVSRYPANIGRYIMLSHKKDKPSTTRYKYLYSGRKRFTSEGLRSTKYRVLDIQLRFLYTWVYVDLRPS